MQFRVRLKGFNFIAHVPAGAQFSSSKDVLAQAPVPISWLAPVRGTSTTPVPCTWLAVEASDEREAEKFFRAACGVARPAAPFVVEAA